MRLERLVVSSSGVDVTIDMHERVTVISLIDEVDRRTITDLLVRALQNQQPRDELTTMLDESGTSGVVVRGDGERASDVVLHLDGLRNRCVISAPAPVEPTPGLSAELRRLALELADVSSSLDLAREELASLAGSLSGSGETAETRRRLLEALEPIERRIITTARTEACEQAAMLDDEIAKLSALIETFELDSDERDEKVAEAAAKLASLSAAWRQASAAAATSRVALREDDPSQRTELDFLVGLPEAAPAGLRKSADKWKRAVEEVDALSERLREVRDRCDTVLSASSTVRQLVTHDPDELFDRVAALELAESEVAESLPEAPTADATSAVVETPSLSGRRGWRRKKQEEDTTEDFSSTLQWVAATFDPDARARADKALERLHELSTEWNADFPEISYVVARSRENDVRAAWSRRLADNELFELAEDTEAEFQLAYEALVEQTSKLSELLGEFGLQPSSDAVEKVGELLQRRERAQAVRDAVEATRLEREASVELEQIVSSLAEDVEGATLGSLETRESAVERAAAAAVVRSETTGAPDIEGLRAEREALAALRERFQDILSSNAKSIEAARDLQVAETLIDERTMLHLELAALPDVSGFEMLARRHIAVANEVRTLEARQSILRDAWEALGDRHIGADPSTVAMEELESILRARLVAARLERLASVAGRGSFGRLPLILDDPFVDLDDEHRDRLLQLVGEISADVQIVFLTEDRSVKAWARNSDYAALLEADSSAA